MPCRMACASVLELVDLVERAGAGVDGVGAVPVEAGVRCLGGIVEVWIESWV
jgi:hypothetical protein